MHMGLPAITHKLVPNLKPSNFFLMNWCHVDESFYLKIYNIKY